MEPAPLEASGRHAESLRGLLLRLRGPLRLLLGQSLVPGVHLCTLLLQHGQVGLEGRCGVGRLCGMVSWLWCVEGVETRVGGLVL